MPHFAAAVMLWAGAACAAVPAVESLTMVQTGGFGSGDLELSWPPVAPVDGYRVYEYDSESCGGGRVVCDGTAPTCLLPGALAGPSPRLWRVAAYAGSEEGPLTAPAYFYSLPLGYAPTSANLNLAAVPGRSTWARDREMCEGLVWRDPARLLVLGNFDPAQGVPRWCFCETQLHTFDLVPGRAYTVRPSQAGESGEIFGSGHPELSLDLGVPRGSGDIGLHLLSLPYDHAYSDLAALAAEVPGALDVMVLDAPNDRRVGLTRASTADAWSGDNVDLLPLRGQGVLLTVAAPTSWLPRRICGAPGELLPRRVNGLQAVRSGSAVELRWQIDPLAGGGYDVVRTSPATAIAGARSLPAHLSAGGPDPGFPVADPGAVVAAPTLLFYQVFARSPAGTRGGP